MIFPAAFPLLLGLFLLSLAVLVVVVEFKILGAPPVAYVSGSMGALIGGDLLNLPRIGDLVAPVVSIGGAGTFDGVFLTGLMQDKSGHDAVPHGDHVDYVVNGHLHHSRDKHCDDHGAVQLARS